MGGSVCALRFSSGIEVSEEAARCSETGLKHIMYTRSILV